MILSSIFIYCLVIMGGTYAYFALTAVNDNTVVGVVGSADLDLKVEKILPTSNNGDMIPQLESALGTAISNQYNCVDENGNVVCKVYKATLTNNSTSNVRVNGSVSFTGVNEFSNLRWKRIENATTIGTYDNHDASVSDVIFEKNRLFIMNESEEYYFVIWIDEKEQEQIDIGTFRMIIKINSDSDDGLTSTFVLANEPNLDNNNLIPVYFDENEGTYGSWKKADSTNANNSWYDYDNKMWANAIMVSDTTKRATYQNATVGTTITDSDITAFYVWIPRYKYRVWNISRQGGAENTYAYSAYSNGIQIQFENGTASTGNVVCSYDDQTTGSATYLSDNCSVNGTAVSYNTSNLVYGESNQAWYTHPAFNFGDSPKTGFWIGKFGTTGTVSAPTVLPNVQSLRGQNISDQFMISKKFQTYLINSTLDAHMLTNLEWGAVTYLTHSIYGLCDESTCNGVNNNNSNGYYTGRSGGAIADGTYTTYGTYDYKGYILSDNTPTNSKDITKVASTTKNITGVYDLSGGAYDYVMGNMVNSSNGFYENGAGSAWNNTEWYNNTNGGLYSKYYNSYAYGTEFYGTIAFNRARLGDATAEVLGGTTNSSSWRVGSGINRSRSYFVYDYLSWFSRGGIYNNLETGVFYFSRNTGYADNDHTFRSALS